MANTKAAIKRTMPARKKALPPLEEKAVSKYKFTEHELTVAQEMLENRRNRPLAPGINVSRNETGDENFEIDHTNKKTGMMLLQHACATTSGNFMNGLLSGLGDAVSKGSTTNETRLNFALAVIDGIKPKDQIETMLAAQIAAIYLATMKMARRLGNAENIPQQDSAERALNKLARTFTAQLEALKRYRSTGEQKVTVQHVTVNEGGQAIVGTVEQSKAGGEGEHGKV